MDDEERAMIDKILASQTSAEKKATIGRWRELQKSHEDKRAKKAVGEMIRWLKGTVKGKKRRKKPKESE